ncbi:LysR family transcriptional regulator [Leptolyngbya sp. FACHB-541]|uniref:LysR family transcriptional regulator n=1 Tax=Leptolyngbya sp. FACHB-541 TaxID=2692810 RepID=UPI0016882069|nr:LysR family transcriptional regulator [Leptolyngbya sp. FACHB-541]MBD1999068.1 LysR family transcriptional regulator [Leptolyngbya sp. FACHB-541]
MELRHLKYFVAVAEELNFRRAAERLFMEQPPLSRQIRQLEDELGVELFYRNRQGVSLTAAGRAFLDEARLALAQAERAAQAARQAGEAQQTKLVIGFSICVFNRLLSNVIQTFREIAPTISISLTEASTAAQVQAIATKDIDVGFVHLPLDHPDLCFETVLTEQLVAVLPQGHSLAALPAIPLHLLANEPFVLCPEQVKPDFYYQIMRLCEQAGFQPKVAQEATPPEVVISFVEAGAGVSLVASGAQTRHSAGVVYRAIAESTPPIEVAVAWHKQNQSPTLSQFLKVVRDARSKQISLPGHDVFAQMLL